MRVPPLEDRVLRVGVGERERLPRARCEIVDRLRPSHALVPPVIRTDRVQNGEQPGPRIGSRREPVEASIGAQEGLLDEVVREVDAADHASRGRAQQRREWHRERFEAVAAARRVLHGTVIQRRAKR
jgi:hypothetical protein